METTLRLLSGYSVTLVVLALALGGLSIYSRREWRLRTLNLVLSVAVVVVGSLAFAELPGKPRGIVIDEFREHYHCAKILHGDIDEKVGIRLLVKKKNAREAEYVFVEWNMRLAKSLQEGQRFEALNKKKGAIVYGGKTCFASESSGGGHAKKKALQLPGSSGGDDEGGGEDGFSFHADPVTPTPEKNYGPLYEGPITPP